MEDLNQLKERDYRRLHEGRNAFAMKALFAALTLAALPLLTACDATPKLGSGGGVIGPGYKVQVGDKLVAIWGEDSCEQAFSNRPDPMNCIDLDRAKSEVVMLHRDDDGRVVSERWRVERSGENVSLRTPAGVVVGGV